MHLPLQRASRSMSREVSELWLECVHVVKLLTIKGAQNGPRPGPQPGPQLDLKMDLKLDSKWGLEAMKTNENT